MKQNINITSYDSRYIYGLLIIPTYITFRHISPTEMLVKSVKPLKQSEASVMAKLDIMKNFASTFVGDDFYLIIKSGDTNVLVHTIEIIQKTDDSCQLKDITVGDYFFRILAVDADSRQAYILCNWSEQLLQNLLTQRLRAKEAGFNKIIMTREPPDDSDNWLLMWGDKSVKRNEMLPQPSQLKYIY